jgi:2-hydroxy-6-oxonona-2,4-dienedioate hydrolase
VSASRGEVATIRSGARIFRSQPANGGTIVWRSWPGPSLCDGLPAGAGARDTLLLLHGSYGSWTHWLRNVEPLSRAMTVVAVDMPGFGDSRALPSDPSPIGVVRLLEQGWRQLCASQVDPPLAGPGRVFVAGFSLGAVYAGWLARALLADPCPARRVGGLVLLSPGGLGTRGAARPQMKRVPDEGVGPAARRVRLDVHRHNLSVVMFGDARRIDETAVRVQDANVQRTRFRRPPGQAPDLLLDVLPALPVPMIALWGARDAFDTDIGIRVAALTTAAPLATTSVIAGAGHWIGYEAASEVNQALLRWLRTLSI